MHTGLVFSVLGCSKGVICELHAESMELPHAGEAREQHRRSHEGSVSRWQVACSAEQQKADLPRESFPNSLADIHLQSSAHCVHLEIAACLLCPCYAL